MKKILIGVLFLLAPILALAQTHTNGNGSGGTASITGGTISNAAITNSTATTQPFNDNSTFIATDSFVQTNANRRNATYSYNLAVVVGTQVSSAGIGSGASIVYSASGGAITSVVAIATPGTGYAVGDIIIDTNGNGDAAFIVTTVSGGGVTGAGILYGGTQYSGFSVTGTLRNPNSDYIGTYNLSGLLTSNLVFLVTPGTNTTQSKQWVVNNNTTGAFTITYQMSGQSGGVSTDTPIGTGVLIQQGTNNSAAAIIRSDGVTDIWLAAPELGVSFDPNYSYQVPVTGGTINIAVGTGTVIIDPATALATLTVNLPACTASYNGALVRFSTSKTITSLTVTTSGGTVAGAPATLTIGTGNQYICKVANTTWHRLY